jgi:hypothetical protein
MVHHYGDIPESQLKRNLPLDKHLWRLYQKLGWDYLKRIYDIIFSKVPDTFLSRLKDAIKLAKRFIEGQIPKNSACRTLSYQLFPSFSSIRCDLQQGTIKLLHGDSFDITFVAFREPELQIDFLINSHFEEGFPVDLWVIEPESEILDTSHFKTGYRMRELYLKTKDMKKAGSDLLHLLRDIRNERTPQFSQSDYQLAMIMGSSLANLGFEYSSHELWAAIWDCANAKRCYKMPDSCFSYVPCPPLINTFWYLNRPSFTSRMTGLMTESKLFLQGLEAEYVRYGKEQIPEAYLIGTVGYFQQGIPRPRHTLDCMVPNLKDNSVINDEKFNWIYDQTDRFLHLEDIGMTVEDALECIYLDITPDTPHEENIDESKIISTGIGTKTQFRE